MCCAAAVVSINECPKGTTRVPNSLKIETVTKMLRHKSNALYKNVFKFLITQSVETIV